MRQADIESLYAYISEVRDAHPVVAVMMNDGDCITGEVMTFSDARLEVMDTSEAQRHAVELGNAATVAVVAFRYPAKVFGSVRETDPRLS